MHAISQVVGFEPLGPGAVPNYRESSSYYVRKRLDGQIVLQLSGIKSEQQPMRLLESIIICFVLFCLML
jgi:hypothetical protein